MRNGRRPVMLLLLAAALAAGCASARPGDDSTPSSEAMVERGAPLFDGLGTHHHPIRTDVPLAQRYFDQGLIFTYGFNHAEAVRSFREAARHDPACAICYWGVALALGPNINAPMADEAVPEAYAALQQALALAEHAGEAERAYIAALATRYVEHPPEDRHALDVAYAEAMRELARRYPDDLDAATLYAEAVMDTMPWHYWTEDGRPRPGTEEVLAVLESVLARDPGHPGANHYYIHAVEAVHPERALEAPDRLGTLVPAVGHLVHMPAHIYLRVGRYDLASRANERAAAADESYFAQSAAQGLYPALYYPHNVHFLWYSATLEGRDAVALEAARKLVTIVGDEQVEREPGLQLFTPTPWFALAQFGRWEEILRAPQPPADRAYSLAMWHYARGLALAGLGKPEEAERELAALAGLADAEAVAALERTALAFPAVRLVRIARHVLAGDIARRRGEDEAMLRHFRAAVEIQDGLPYMEPPYWYVPVRLFLGEALLRAGSPGEAERVYQADLTRNPRNGWSLFGLHASLRAQDKTGEAAEAKERFEDAWARATVTLGASRF